MPVKTANSSVKISPGKTPLAYVRVEEDLRAKIRDGRLPAGTMLAGRHMLAREYGVALSTAQQAVARLIADGLLETSDRRGTFVARRQTGSGQKSSHASGTRQTTATLGIVATVRVDPAASPDIGSLWMRLAIRSLEQVFSNAGGSTRFFERYPESRGPYPFGADEAYAISIPDAMRSLREGGADAIAVIGLCDARDMSDEVVSGVDVEHIPTVYISWHEIPPPLAQIFYDNRYAGYQAAQHLLSRGYRRLLFLAPFSDDWLSERIAGARDAVRHAGLPPDTLSLYPPESPVQRYDPKADRGYASSLFATLFTRVPTEEDGSLGIIAPNDIMAYGVLDAAGRSGLVAGLDFGLIGFDDDPRSCTAGLTTIRPPVEAMGEAAGHLLLRALAHDKTSQVVRLRSHLIPRASTVR